MHDDKIIHIDMDEEIKPCGIRRYDAIGPGHASSRAGGPTTKEPQMAKFIVISVCPDTRVMGNSSVVQEVEHDIIVQEVEHDIKWSQELHAVRMILGDK